VKNILIIAEILAGQIRPVTYELIAAARKIETFLSQAGENPHIRVIIPADNPEPLAEKLAAEIRRSGHVNRKKRRIFFDCFWIINSDNCLCHFYSLLIQNSSLSGFYRLSPRILHSQAPIFGALNGHFPAMFEPGGYGLNQGLYFFGSDSRFSMLTSCGASMQTRTFLPLFLTTLSLI